MLAQNKHKLPALKASKLLNYQIQKEKEKSDSFEKVIKGTHWKDRFRMVYNTRMAKIENKVRNNDY